MKLLRSLTFFPALLTVLAVSMPTARAAENGDSELLSKLKQSKHSLVDGIAQSEKQNGPAISAKFELEDGTLMLSIYNARAGREKDAEHNELIEVAGDAGQPSWSPKTEVFEDKEHLTRSAMQLTLVQTSKLTLTEAVKKGESAGTVYSAIPAVKEGRPVFVLKAATPQGSSTELVVDGQTGAVSKM